jgi:foldase protein PrsA
MKKETKKKTTKTTNRPARKTRSEKMKEEKVILPVESSDFDEETMIPATSTSPSRKYLAVLVAALVIVGLVLYKYQYLVAPASVNGRPVFIWQYLSYMHKTYGQEALQTLTTQALIEQEIGKSNVVVGREEIQKEVDSLDKQASASGGITAMLAAQQMTMDQLKDQIRIQLAVKKILKDKILVSDAEVEDAYKKNRDFFKNVPEAEAKERVRSQIENQKFQKEASTWLADIKQKSNVKITYPGLQ